LPRREVADIDAASITAAVGTSARPAWFDTNAATPTTVLRDAALKPGETVSGPAIIEHPTTTIVVPPGLTGQVTSAGSFMVELTARATA
jgi:N-methylhydantoinase A